MDFFSNCKTKEEAKATFKRLCKCFHPDKGGEEALMIELKRQYDVWNPMQKQMNTFNFSVSGTAVSNVYEGKINELNRIIYQLRQELDLLRIHSSFDKDAYNAESRQNREMKKQMNDLNMQLEDKKRELMKERDRINNMSVGEKIKKVFGYD